MVKKAKPKFWIKSAIRKPGAFTAQAKQAGKNVPAFAKQVLKPSSKASATTKKRAVLAQTLAKFRKAKRKK